MAEPQVPPEPPHRRSATAPARNVTGRAVLGTDPAADAQLHSADVTEPLVSATAGSARRAAAGLRRQTDALGRIVRAEMRRRPLGGTGGEGTGQPEQDGAGGTMADHGSLSLTMRSL